MESDFKFFWEGANENGLFQQSTAGTYQVTAYRGTVESSLYTIDVIDPEPEPIRYTNVYRFWSSKNKHHFYTASNEESEYIKSNYPADIWSYEGVAYQAVDPNNCSPQNPVYRFWSNQKQGHFYTSSEAEKQHVIVAYDDNVWKYEGIAFCADEISQPGNAPLYRFWSNKYQAHFYTSSEAEKQLVIDSYDDNTWKYEGIAYYVDAL